MAKKNKGYIPLWRDIQDNFLWVSEDPFDIRSAWIDILLMVNYEDKKCKIGSNIIVVHAGQVWTSYRKLALRWRWSINRVKRYTHLLVSDDMITLDATTNGTLLTVVNYGNFAIRQNTNEYTDEYTDELTPGTRTNTRAIRSRTITKEINNNKKDNKGIRNKEIDSAAPPCPGEGYEWVEYEGVGRWIAPPADGSKWQ